MSADPSPNGSKKKLNISPLLIVAVIAALVVAAGAGALAYRTYLTNKKDDPKPQQQASTGGIKNTGAPGAAYDAQFNTKSMYPAFNPDRHYYVTRCVPGKIEVQVNAKPGSTVKVGPYPAKSGRYKAEARPLPSQDFNILISSGGQTQTYQVRCLPDDFPQWNYTRFKDPPKGMFFVSFRPEPKDAMRSWAVVFDQDGTPRWWFSTPTNTLGGQILRDGTFQVPRGFGDGFGKDSRTGNEIRSLDGKLLRVVRTKNAPTDGHEYTLLPNGNALIMSYKPVLGVDLTSVGGPADAGVLTGEIQEITPSGKVVWSWNSLDHVPLDFTAKRWWKKVLKNPHTDIDGNERYDMFHLNSIEPFGKDQLVISTRHTDKVFGISRKTGKILWTFGGEPDKYSLKIEGDDPRAEYPIGGNHDARISDGNLLSVHDNSTHLDRPPRAVEYRIDLKNRTATYVGQQLDPKKIKDSHCCGGVRPFGTGWIVAWGNNPFVDGFNSENELAFRLGLPIPVYRAVPVPPEVTERDLNRALEKMEIEPPMSNVPVNPIVEYKK
ncbi:MAG TPA: arylsulfotransferase family protein [Solirubrobacterales bacterium]|nr:arylsulfotransferase family protein [Solirubrobacterales bacterium]